jgi:hypothetical protein
LKHRASLPAAHSSCWHTPSGRPGSGHWVQIWEHEAEIAEVTLD